MSGALLVAGVLLVVAGLLRAGGASLVRSTRADALHDAAEGVRGAETVAELLEHRDRLQPAIGAVHSILLVVSATLAAWAVTSRFEGSAEVLALVGVALLEVVGGDLAPRALGRAQPQRLAYRLAPMLAVAVAVGRAATDLIVEEGEVLEERRNGDGDEDDEGEIELISSVLEFTETIVREVMVPRTDMVTIPRSATLDQLIQLVAEHGYSRIPVTAESGEDILGVVIAKDLLPLLGSGERPAALEELMRPVDFVPETKRVSDLLKEMQVSKSHLAVVVDEYGGVAGLVTIEDLLEELVGEISDEYDEDELLVEEQGEGVWLVDARLSVTELAEIVEADLPDEDWDTVGGLVLGLAGRVPHEMEHFDVDGVRVTVTRVQGRRVAEVLVERRPPEEQPVGETA